MPAPPKSRGARTQTRRPATLARRAEAKAPPAQQQQTPTQDLLFGGPEQLHQASRPSGHAAVQRLQQTHGNQAVQRLVAERAVAQRTVVQRDGEESSSSSTATLDATGLEQAVATQVNALPTVAEESIPDPARAEEGNARGEEVRQTVVAMSGSNPEVQAFNLGRLSEEANAQGDDQEEVGPAPLGSPQVEAMAVDEEIAPTRGRSSNVTEPSSPNQSTSSFSSVETQGSVKSALTTSQSLADTTATATSSIATHAPTVSLPSTGADKLLTIGKVTSTIGFVFAGIQALLDVRAVISSGMKAKELSEIAAAAKSAGQPAEIVDAVIFAMEQKYKKVINRSISFVTSALSVSTGIALLVAGGLAALATGPVGWGALGVLAAIGLVIGLGALTYKLGRYLYKWWKGTLHVERKKTAIALHNYGVKGQNQTAMAAVRALGLDPAVLRQARGSSSQGLFARLRGTRTPAQEQTHQQAKVDLYEGQRAAEMRQAEQTSDAYPIKKQKHLAKAKEHEAKAKEHREKLSAANLEAQFTATPAINLIYQKLGT